MEQSAAKRGERQSYGAREFLENLGWDFVMTGGFVCVQRLEYFQCANWDILVSLLPKKGQSQTSGGSFVFDAKVFAKSSALPLLSVTHCSSCRRGGIELVFAF